MNRLDNTIVEIHRLDELALRPHWLNEIHPMSKLITTVVYIAITVSFHKYNLIGLLGMLIYPAMLFSLAELSIKDCFVRIRIILPIILAVGIANPFLDKSSVDAGGIIITGGILSMVTLMMKGILAVLASYLLIATTTMEKLCFCLRLLHFPAIIVTQIMLTYRYITVLLGEASRMTSAYSLRAPGQKGIHFRAWGSLAGLLLLRSIDRADELYQSMTLRGYAGDYSYIGTKCPLKLVDIIYLLIWISLIILLRIVPVFALIGGLL